MVVIVNRQEADLLDAQALIAQELVAIVDKMEMLPGEPETIAIQRIGSA